MFLLFAVLALAVAPGSGRAVQITAARLEADEDTGVVVARGPARISDGSTVLTGQRLVVDLGKRRAVVTEGQAHTREEVLEAARFEVRFSGSRITGIRAHGDASLQRGRSVVLAQLMEFRFTEGRLVASGEVRVFTPPDVVAFGSKLTYDRPTGRVALTGPVRVQTGQGAVYGAALEGSLPLEEATVYGDVQIEYVDLTGRAETARVLGREQKAVLLGGVFIQRGRQTLWADRVTVFYASRRIVAEGLRQLVIDEESGRR